MPPPATQTAMPSMAEEIDRVIARFNADWRPGKLPCRLRFPDELEQAFGIETSTERNHELALMLPVAYVLYVLTAITDPVFVPDIGLLGLVLRLLATPLMTVALVCGPRLASGLRERLLTLSLVVAMMILIIVTAASRSPLAPFSYATVCLALIFANTTVPLRFAYACVTTIIICGGLLVSIDDNPSIGPGLTFALGLQIVVAGFFSLIANYRIERGLRLTYLLAAKDRRRLATLAAEREDFAALARTDGLTGLANRIQLDRRAAALLADPLEAGRPISVLMIDVDYFKRYNDHYGHMAGDACLRAIARVIADLCPGPESLPVRFGGEEFVVLLANLAVGRVDMIAQSIRGAVAERALEHANREDALGVVTVSVGMGHMIVGDGSTVADALDRADRALYAAKRLGRNRVEALWPQAA